MSETTPSARAAWIPHVIPYVAWIFIMGLLGDPTGWKYVLRSLLCLGLLLWCRPWRFSYPKFNPKHLPGATLAGLAVLAVWILPETDLFTRFETFHRLYLTVGHQMPWSQATPLEMVRYAPETDGWLFALGRLAGSALVIAVIEEFFWRGWLTRWVEKETFLSVDPGTVSWKSILIASLLFATTHVRWIAGLFCGLLWGWYYRKTKDIWAVTWAHVLCNGLLGVYVLWSGKYEFWA